MSPLVGTIQVQFPNYFNSFQTDEFLSIAEIFKKTISENLGGKTQGTGLLTI